MVSHWSSTSLGTSNLKHMHMCLHVYLHVIAYMTALNYPDKLRSNKKLAWTETCLCTGQYDAWTHPQAITDFYLSCFCQGITLHYMCLSPLA